MYSRAYYNENDPFAAAWLRNLIASNLIAQGEVDERSIADVRYSDLRGFTQCHFFAGIGVWSYALRLAGWPDYRPVWTGSCPCQPFSEAGARQGFSDPRHLWPDWFRLIRLARPVAIFGEQVDGALDWFDLVSGDLESKGYAVGAAIMGAHSVGAPHTRQRLYWVGVDNSPESRRTETREHDGGSSLLPARFEQSGGVGDVAHAERNSRRARGIAVESSESDGAAGAGAYVESGRCGDPRGQEREVSGRGGEGSREEGLEQRPVHSGLEHPSCEQMGLSRRARESRSADSELGDSGCKGPSEQRRGRIESPRPTATGFWSDCIWLPCIDGKARPTKPGIFPLAHGATNRVGMLRGAGNALVAPQAQAFIEACMELA